MKKLITGLSLIALLALGVFAQNSRTVQDAARALDSKLSGMQDNFENQMRSNSVDQGQIDVVMEHVADLQNALGDFEHQLNARRENRKDVQKVVDAAQRLNDVVGDVATNRQMSRAWQSTRDQVDRLAREYGVVTRWQDASVNGGISGPYSGQSSPDPAYSDNDNGRPAPTPTGRHRLPPVLSNNGSGTVSVGLSGTYQLDRQASENVDDIVRGANVSDDQQSDLRDKLEAPDQIALDIRGSQVTLATSKGDPVTFTADGREKTQNANGRTVRLKATIGGDTLTVSSLGGETDFNITFQSISGGRALKVSRRITTDYLKQTVFAESLYNKTDSVAKLDIGGGTMPATVDNSGTATTTTSTGSTDNRGYSDNDQGNTTVSNGGSNAGGYNNGNGGYNNGGRNNGGWSSGGNNRTGNNNRGYNGGAPQVTTRTGNFVVPNGVTLSGRLETLVTTKVSQNGDRFRLTVQSPAEYQGAVLEGYLSGIDRSGKISGQSAMTFNFEKIRLANGQTYDFAGQVMSVNNAMGKVIKVDNEGTIRGDNQTNETAKRGAAGGGLGALIGAIAGGGKGAAIGAIIGAAGGASTVLYTGKDDVELQAGSTLSIQSTSPRDIVR
jgi:hypothetical protein